MKLLIVQLHITKQLRYQAFQIVFWERRILTNSSSNNQIKNVADNSAAKLRVDYKVEMRLHDEEISLFGKQLNL